MASTGSGDRKGVSSGALAAAFAVSGAAGLMFEMVWFYQASLVLGNTVWAASIVLSSFMGGLGLGNFLAGWQASKLRSPLRTYALLEIAVGAGGVAATYVLPHLTGLIVRFAPAATSELWYLHGVRLAIAFTVLVVPATAMGATLPVAIGAAQREESALGRAFGRLYGWNTIGAVCGVLAAEIVLISAVGVTGTAWAALLLNCMAAAIALTIVRRSPDRSIVDRPPAVSVTSPTVAWRLLAGAALAGGTFMALEVLWFRFLSMYVLTTTLPMSVMLAVVLAGIGGGGLLASRRSGTRPLWPGAPVVALLAGCAIVVSYRLFGSVTSGSQIADWRQVVWFALVLTGPTAVLSGAFLTTLADSFARAGSSATRTSAWLLLANTAGSTFGPLVATFVLLPALGMERAFFALSATYLVVGLLATPPRSAESAALSWKRSWTVGVAAAATLIALATFPFGLMNEYHERIVRSYAADGSQIVAAREGPSETILLMRLRWLNHTVYDRLVTNGFSMSGTAAPARRYMKYFAYWPMMLHAEPLRRALLICYGVGMTAAALTDIPSLQSIDVVETSRDIVAMSDRIHSADENPLNDPRVRLHIEDGRYFLATSTDRYDLITGEPPPPRTPGAVNIYTQEYFQLIYDRLAEGGVVTYWLPVARPDPGTDVNAIVGAFCAVFRDCSLWNATPSDFMLVGMRNAKGPVDTARLTGAWDEPDLAAKLRAIGVEAPQQIGATFLGDADFLRTLAGTAPALTDNFPQRLRPGPGRPSLSDPRYGSDAAVRQLYERVLDTGRARHAFAQSAFIRALWPADLLPSTPAFFEPQRILNRVLWDGARPLQQIEDLHYLLTKTTLRTLPLWLLGSDEVMQRIASNVNDGSGAVEYTLGLQALATRDYPQAVARFERATALGVRLPALQPLLAFSLCMDDQAGRAREIAQTVVPGTPDERHFWSWLRAEFRMADGVSPN